MALSFGHIGISGITEIKKAATPTDFRKSLTASLRRFAATASAILAQSRSVVERLSSTMNGASYSASFLMALRRFAASTSTVVGEHGEVWCQEFSQLPALTHASVAERPIDQNHRWSIADSIECDRRAVLRYRCSRRGQSR